MLGDKDIRHFPCQEPISSLLSSSAKSWDPAKVNGLCRECCNISFKSLNICIPSFILHHRKHFQCSFIRIQLKECNNSYTIINTLETNHFIMKIDNQGHSHSPPSVLRRQKVGSKGCELTPLPGITTNNGHVIQDAHTPNNDLILPVRGAEATSGHLHIQAKDQGQSQCNKEYCRT